MNHEGLIDTVSDIVKIYGISILSGSRFWNILADSYSFKSDYSLRNTFRTCISEGHVEEIVALRGNKDLTIEMIDGILRKEDSIDGSKWDELKIVLYSVAIAVGTCDYSDCANHRDAITKNSDKSLRSSSPSSIVLEKNDTHLSDRDAVTTLVIYIFGLVFSLGGVYSYSQCYIEYGLSLGEVTFLTGLCQFVFTACVAPFVLPETYKTIDSVDRHRRTVLLSFLFPIFVSFIANSLFSFLFLIPSFYTWLGHHIYGIDLQSEVSNSLHFWMSLMYFIFIGVGCMKCYDESISTQPTVDILFNMHKWIDRAILKVSSGIVIFFYILLYFWPSIFGMNVN